jgi:hypothetical protein
MNNTIGIHYELPNGQIAYTYGWDGQNKTVSYRFDDGKGTRTVSQEEFNTWKPRQDLNDFPNATDPRLPYVFDLFWDIKYKSQLKWALENEPDSDEIKEKMKEHNITI